MPVYVRWADAEETIVLYVYDKRWTWQEVSEAVDEVERWSAEKGRLLPTIHDLTQSYILPQDAFIQARSIALRLPESTSLVIVGGGVTRIIVESIRRINRQFAEQCKLANTVEEAVELIKRERQRQSKDNPTA